MNKSLKSFILVFFAALPFLWFGCAGPAHISVGVGVAVPGPWIGPYPGGGIWVGRPFPGHYYPLKDNYRHFIQDSKPDVFEPKDTQNVIITRQNDEKKRIN